MKAQELCRGTKYKSNFLQTSIIGENSGALDLASVKYNINKISQDEKSLFFSREKSNAPQKPQKWRKLAVHEAGDLNIQCRVVVE